MFELIHAERAQFPVALSRRVLGVSRSGYYAWLQRALRARVLEPLGLEETGFERATEAAAA